MGQAAPSESLFDIFCSAFGEQGDVRKEIEEYWDNGGSPFPDQVYAYLVEKRKTAGQLTESQAQFLTAYFHESFAPERTTGYADKHREPLIAAFAEAYAKGGQRPMFRVEADIANLGGLNRHLAGKPGIKSHEADQVIGVMAAILKEQIGNVGEICAIRHGGDELCLYVRPYPHIEQSEAAIQHALSATHLQVAEFITDALLTDVNHEKKGKDAGVGMGAAAIAITNQTRLAQYKALQQAIPTAKQECLNHLGAGTQTPPANTSPPQHVRQALEKDPWAKYAHAAENISRKDFKRPPTSNQDPEQARLEFLRSTVGEINTPALGNLIKATRRLTAKRDPATELLMFKDMESDILPCFLRTQPEKLGRATLTHFDFSNVGGGNELGYWVGNAMRATFADCIKEALADKKLGEYIPYLAAQDGGKFALLLPPHITRREINAISTAIEMRLANHARDPLPLGADELAESLALMEGKAHYQACRETGTLTIGDVLSLKAPQYKGVQVMTAATLLDVSKPYVNLGAQMRGLEEHVAALHGKKDKIIEDRSRQPRAIGAVKVDTRRNWLARSVKNRTDENPTPSPTR